MPSPPKASDAALKELLKKAGLRVTGVRLAVLRALRDSAVALDANTVAESLETAGETADRVTVYRTLNTLVESGIAHRIDAGDRTFRYSLTDHGRCTEGHHEHEHPHMVCDRCGAVECIEDAEVIIKPRERGKGVRAGAGKGLGARKFRITQQSVLLHGTCDRCADSPRHVQAKKTTS